VDTLTGRLNHGALVDAVALAIERSEADGRPFAIALLDIDNFRLLNENYGDAAGDDALLTVVHLLDREVPPGASFGRYGPDELLMVVPTDEIHVLDGVLARVRAAPVDHALQFDMSERLPLTLSVGVCTYPAHAESVTGLLTVAAASLRLGAFPGLARGAAAINKELAPGTHPGDQRADPDVVGSDRRGRFPPDLHSPRPAEPDGVRHHPRSGAPARRRR